LFHARGPAAANDRSPSDDVVRGTATELDAADLRPGLTVAAADGKLSGANGGYVQGEKCPTFTLASHLMRSQTREGSRSDGGPKPEPERLRAMDWVWGAL